MESEVVFAAVTLSDKENAKPLADLKSIEYFMRARYGARVDKCRIHPLTVARILETKEAQIVVDALVFCQSAKSPLVALQYYLGFRFELDKTADERPTLMPDRDWFSSVPSFIYDCGVTELVRVY